MTQSWIYCSTRFPFEFVARLKLKLLKRKIKRKKLHYDAYVFEWNDSRKPYKEGLELLYGKIQNDRVQEIILYSLKDIGNESEQVDFIETMQELNIPVFCLKQNRYLNKEMKK